MIDKIFDLVYSWYVKVNLGKLLMKAAIILVIIGSFLGGCSYLNSKFGLSDDNLIEEAIEHGIEDATGLNIDLSPESDER